MNPEKIGKQIAKTILLEEVVEKVAIYPGAFKPPHKGHVATALRAKEGDIDRVIIFMSTKERDGVSVEEAQKVWDLYKQNNPELENVEIVQTPTPVKDVYDYAKDNPANLVRAVFGKGEEDRFKSLLDKEKYPHVEVFDAGMEGTYSATELRKAIRDNDLETVNDFIPDGVNVDDFMSIFQLNEAIVGDKIVCDNCGWEWKIADGGNDLYMCHKCGHDNTPKLNEVKYTNPNFDNEWEEAERYSEFVEMGKQGWIDIAKKGYVTSYSKIKNVLGNVDLKFDKLEEPKKQRFQDAFKKGTIEMSIAVKFSDNDYDLVAGNTRLSGLVKNGEDPKIWIVDLSKSSSKLENKYLQEARYKKFLNEGWDNSKAKIINTFLEYCSDYLSVTRPTIKLVNSPEYTQTYHSFGGYMPSEQKIITVVHNRNMADILRTLAHEMVHHMQNLDNRLTPKSGEDGSPDENEANSLAGVIMRKFGRENAHIYEQV